MRFETVRSLAAIILLPAALLSGCQPAAAPASGPGQTQKSPVPTVTLVGVKRGEITRGITLPASVHAFQEATLYAKVTGYLKSISVDKGDAVQKGATIAEIEVPELVADLARYQADLELAEIDYRRTVDAQQRAPDLIVLQNVDTAKGKLAVAKANLQRAQTLLGFTKIVAPFSGIITWRWVDPGAFIPAATAGSAAQNAAVVKLMDFAKVRVQIGVPEPEAPLITSGLPVKIALAQFRDRVLEGVITRHTHALDPASRTLMAEVDLPNPKGELRPGMFASASIGVERKSDALIVPVGAVSQEKSGHYVFKVAQGKAKKTPVQTGFADGASIEIVSGIAENEAIILLSKQSVTDGQVVQVVEAP